MAKADKDGWIRHRGGKCPIYDGALVDYRMRDGEIDDSGRVAAKLRWNHIGGCADIMAYRIHKPEEQPINMEAMAECADALGDSHADVMKSVLSRMDGPLQWRDRIREIDRTVEALEEERVSLIQRLEGEGLQLLQGKVCGSVQAANVLPRGLSWDEAPDWANYLLDSECGLEDSRYSWASSTANGSKRKFCHGCQLEYVVGDKPFTVISSRPSA